MRLAFSLHYTLAPSDTRAEDDHMMRNDSIHPAACDEYEMLLMKSSAALTAWKRGRNEIRRSGRKGRDADNELRVLQANFAKAYAALQTHARDCHACQMPALVYPGFGINPVNTTYPLHQ
jgi:hypothetical protein